MKAKFKYLAFSIIFNLTIIQSISQNSLDSGLVAYYPFTGNAGDSSTNSNNPVYNNAKLTADRFGNPNSAYYFDGQSSYMQIANNPTINFNKSMSICFWMKPMGFYTGLCFNNMLISKGIDDNPPYNAGNYSVRFADYVNGCNSLKDSTKEYLYGPDGLPASNANQKVQTNKWYLVVYTTNGVNSSLYINNKLCHTIALPSSISSFTNQFDLYFGKFNNSSYPYWFKGVMDDIRIYNRGLSEEEVNSLYNTSPYPVVAGNVYVDMNNNGVMDSTDYYKPNTRINGSNGTFAITNLQGNYDLTIDSLGNFSTNIITSNLYTATPTTYNYSFISYDTTAIGDYVLRNNIQLFDSLSLRIIPLFNAARPGFNYPVSVTYTNNGNTILNNATLIIPYDSSKLQFNGSTNLSLVDNGLSLGLTPVDLAPGENISFMIDYKVRTYASLGDTLKLVATVNTNIVNANDSSVTIIRGSYDPNDKEATPLLTTTDVANGKYIDYVVRFENTGTDTAFKVLVTDELSTLLDLNSLQITGLSHPCNISVNDNKISFTFNKIYLPYTGINSIASHGFIAFKIKPKNTVTDGTNIPNKASIYFDYNLPIVTNTAVTKIRNPIITPLKITNFSIALINDENVKNIWSTANEVNVNHFLIQRSFNGINFNNIGEVSAKNRLINDYNYIDKISNITVKNIYYRIIAVDNDGKTQYSETRHFITNNKIKSISVFPNPSSKKINIVKANPEKESLLLTDIHGKVIASITITGLYASIDISNLANGVYMLHFENGENIKFVKQ